MTNPIIKIVNTQTGEEIEREMDSKEFADYEKSREQDATNEAKLQALKDTKAAAQSKLAALGLTADDLKALGL
jgi:hypothetical protein